MQENDFVPDWNDGKHPFLRDEEIPSLLQAWERKKQEFIELGHKLPIVLKIFPRIILEETGNQSDYIEASQMINQVYIWVINQDFFAETGEAIFKNQAERASGRIKTYCKKKFGYKFAKELEGIEKNYLNFFVYERELWFKIQNGSKPTDEEVRKYIVLRASDARDYHAKIIRGFTGNDFSRHLHIWMQLFDIMRDYFDLRKDLEDGMPNVLIMYAIQEPGPERTFSEMTDELVLKSYYARQRVCSIRQELLNEALSLDYGKSYFLKTEIETLSRGAAP